MIVWLWIGGGFMALGTILALAPRSEAPATRRAAGGRRPPSPSPIADDRSEPEDEPLEEVSA